VPDPVRRLVKIESGKGSPSAPPEAVVRMVEKLVPSAPIVIKAARIIEIDVLRDDFGRIERLIPIYEDS
jgi:hypothetical protein